MSKVLLKLYREELSCNPQAKCKFADCLFMGTTLSEIRDHIEDCKERFNDQYICRYCLHTSKTEIEFNKHYKDTHEYIVDFHIKEEELIIEDEGELIIEDIEEDNEPRFGVNKIIHEGKDERPRTHNFSKFKFPTKIN